MLAEELDIFKETRTLCRLLFDYSKHVPRSIRFGTYQQQIDKSVKAMDMVFLANANIGRRAEYLDEYILLLRQIRVMIGLFEDLRYLSVRPSTNLTVLLDRLLQKAYGWRRKSAQQSQR